MKNCSKKVLRRGIVDKIGGEEKMKWEDSMDGNRSAVAVALSRQRVSPGSLSLSGHAHLWKLIRDCLDPESVFPALEFSS